MKKYIILLIFLKLLIIKADYETNLIFKGKCEDEKAKTGACIYHLYDYDSKKHDKYAIFDKCGKGEICDYDYKMCINFNKYKKRKVGESCNYDNDCKYGSCVSNKCTISKEGEKCDKIDCDYGLTCDDSSKCVKLTREGVKIDKIGCMDYLGLDKDYKCVKYGTVADKTEIPYYGNNLICQSGFAHEKYDEASNSYSYICDSIETEPECNDDGTEKKEGKWSDGTIISGDCDSNEDYTGKKIGYNENYSKLKSKLYAKFIEDYKDLDLDELISEGMKWKTKEKWILYNYANKLNAAGIIDSDGEVVEDKKCEYEFIMKALHSNYIKLNIIIITMFSLLLF